METSAMMNRGELEQRLMNRKCFGILLNLLILFLMLWCSGSALAIGTTVSLRPVRAEISMGETLDVEVLINNVSGLYGVDVVLSFEPTIVEVVDFDPDHEGVQVKPGQFPQPDFLAENEVINDFGTIWYAVSQVSPREPANGSGVVMTIRFRGKSPGITEIQIVDVTLSDSGGLQIPVEASLGGEITVLELGVTPVQPSPTLSPSPMATPTYSPSPPATQMQPTPTLARTPTASPTQEPETPTATPLTEAYPLITPTSAESYPISTPGTPRLQETPTLAQLSGTATAMPTTWMVEPTTTRTATYVTQQPLETSPTKLTNTPAKVVAIIPTLRPAPTTAGTLQGTQQEPLIPEDVFIFLAALLILLTGALLFRLVRQANRSGS